MNESAQYKKESIFGDRLRIQNLEKAWSAAKLGSIGAGIGFFGTALFAFLLSKSQPDRLTKVLYSEAAFDHQLKMFIALILPGLWIFWGWRMYSGKGIYSAIFALLFMSYEVAWKIIPSGNLMPALLQIGACYCFIASFRGNLFIRRKR